MEKLIDNISEVEARWLDELYSVCRDQFASVKIPSHDDLHHLRVWEIAKELLIELCQSGVEFSVEELEQLIIAVFFHDVGMVETIDKKHGLAGRTICENYFRDNYHDFSGDLGTVLDAIENHDDKEYKSMVYHGDMHKTILSVLCVCDDLDAFGAVGVFRYMEIYSLRGVSISELPEVVLKNVDSRYKNFQQLYGHLDNFFDKQTQKYQFIDKFYQKLKQEITSSAKGGGAIGVMELFKDKILNGTETINSIAEVALNESKDEYVHSFFKNFQKTVKSGRKELIS